MRALGKRPPTVDARVPPLGAMMARRPTPPPTSNWYADVGEWPMLANDQLGDCVPAAALHHIAQRMAYAKKPVTFTDADALALYEQWAGYDPADPRTDQGTIMSTALALWASRGVTVGDEVDQLAAYAVVDHLNVPEIMLVISQCGGVLLGFECPEAWLETDYLMDLPDGRTPIAGGHCVLLVGYEPTDLGMEFDTISWGARYRMTERGLVAVADEAYAILSRDWLDADGTNPAGIDWDAASMAMAQIRA